MQIRLLPPAIKDVNFFTKLLAFIIDFLNSLRAKINKGADNENPLTCVSHAAQKCYQAENPIWGKRIDEKGRLFTPSHHTTFQHATAYNTFDIEDISIADITLGLHLASPFYNSDQRSGRFCAKMFLEPNYDLIRNYITKFWPEASEDQIQLALDYVKSGVEIFHANFKKATIAAEELIKKERPNANEKYISVNGEKIAQEQLRMFISLIFPTGMDFTANLTALAAMRQSAWTPGMRYATNKMAELVTEKQPELAYVFAGEQSKEDFTPELKNKSGQILFEPRLELLSVENPEKFIMPTSHDMHPIDTLHFQPKYMDNNVCRIETRVELSAATMGQDQRHRTIGRAQPYFTGNFYLPPIPRLIGLQKEAEAILAAWISLYDKLPKTLVAALAPYGAMLSYVKDGSANAIAHEQGKRLCFAAQEEIYNLGRLLREAIEAKYGKDSELLKIFEPPCYRTGICTEGVRYCGRNITLRTSGNYFPKREI